MNAAQDRTGDDLLNMKQLAALTGVPEGTLRYYRCLGRADFIFKPGRQLRGWRSDAMAWMARRQQDTAITAHAI